MQSLWSMLPWLPFGRSNNNVFLTIEFVCTFSPVQNVAQMMPNGASWAAESAVSIIYFMIAATRNGTAMNRWTRIAWTGFVNRNRMKRNRFRTLDRPNWGQPAEKLRPPFQSSRRVLADGGFSDFHLSVFCWLVVFVRRLRGCSICLSGLFFVNW